MAPPRSFGDLQFASIGTFRSLYQTLFVELHLGTPVIPSQNIVFWWGSEPFRTGSLDLGTVTISLQLVDVFGNLDPTGILYSSVLSASQSRIVASRSFTSDEIVVHLSSEQAKRVYRVGTYTVRLVVSGTGTDGPYQSPDETLTVALQNLDDSWWEWTVPTSSSVGWKDRYSVAGNFINSTLASVTVSVTLLEVDLSTGVRTAVGSSISPLSMGAGQNTAITFVGVDLAKTWQWFFPVVYLPIGPFSNSFAYRVRLDISDEFSNAFPPFFPTNIVTVIVTVSAQKQSFAWAAYGLMTAAAVLLAAAAVYLLESTLNPDNLGYAAAAAGAGTAAAAAGQACGVAANDPPVPDPRYRTLLQPQSVTLVEYVETKSLLPFFRAVFDVIAHGEALGQTDSRLAGAYAAEDQRAVKLQRDHFRALARKLSSLASTVERNTQQAAGWFASQSKVLKPTRLNDAVQSLSHDLQFRASLRQKFFEAGGTDTNLEALTSLLSVADFANVLSDPKTIVFVVAHSAKLLARTSSEAKPTEPPQPQKTRKLGSRRKE